MYHFNITMMKKLNRLLYIFISAFICVSIFSCESVLEKEPLGVLTADVVYDDDVLLTDFVNSTYGAVRSGFYQERLTLDALTDNSFMKHDRNTFAFTRGQMTAESTGNEEPTFNQWQHSYSYIRRSNLFFTNTVESEVTPELLDRLTGEMHFITAYSYYELLRHYGGVPIIEEVLTLDDEFNTPRSTYDETVDYIVNHLDMAITLLDAYGYNDGRASSAAAMALKSRVLLYAASPLNNPSNDTAKWQAASDAAKSVIDLGIYSLDSDYVNLFLREGSPEHIWIRTFNQNDGHAVDLNNNPNGFDGWGGTLPLQDLIDAYEMSNGEPPYLEDGSINPSSGYDESDPYVNRDPRFYSTILFQGAPWKGRPIDVSFPNGLDSNGPGVPGNWNASNSGYYCRKFLTEENPVNNSQRSVTPWVFFRLTEMYLNYAEAQIELGNADEAKTYINLVRARVGMPPVTETGDALRERYRKERRIEMVFEDQRIFDVNRWLIAEDVLGKPAYGVNVSEDGMGGFIYDFTRVVDDTRAWDPAYVRFPIPFTETQINKNLEQNPGY